MREAGKRRTGLVAFVILVAFLGGGFVGARYLGHIGRTPCWQVVADLETARNTLAETFGGGEAGVAALTTLRDAARRRPDCFSPTTRQLYEVTPDTGPTDTPATEPQPSATTATSEASPS